MDHIKIGKFEESDFDGILAKAGGQRLSADEGRERQLNADYALGEAVVELKLVKEEGLEKDDRRRKVAAVFRAQQPDRPVIILRPELLDEDGRRSYYSAMVGPIKGHVKKAAKQLEVTAARVGGQPVRALLLINNGYAALSHEEFKDLAFARACNDTRNIDAVVVGGLYYYSDKMDMYFFERLELCPVSADRAFKSFEVLRLQWLVFVEQFMTEFVRAENPRSRTRLPVVDLRYDLDGVTFVKPAPLMGEPSKLWPNGRPRENSTGMESCPPVARTFPKMDEQNWRLFRDGLPDSEEFFKDSYRAWLQFQNEEDKESSTPDKPFVPVTVSFEDFSGWRSESGAPPNVQALAHYANEVFCRTIRRLMDAARDRTACRILMSEYVLLVTEEIGQDKANDLSSICHVYEGMEDTRSRELVRNQRIFLEHGLALACAYAIKLGAETVLYEKDLTHAWV